MLTMVADEDRYVSLIPLGWGQTYIAVQTRSAPMPVKPGDHIATMRTATDGIAGPVPAMIDSIRSDDDVVVGPAEEVAGVDQAAPDSAIWRAHDRTDQRPIRRVPTAIEPSCRAGDSTV